MRSVERKGDAETGEGEGSLPCLCKPLLHCIWKSRSIFRVTSWLELIPGPDTRFRSSLDRHSSFEGTWPKLSTAAPVC